MCQMSATFRGYPLIPQYERMILLKQKDIRIVARVTQKEKERISSLAARCGLTTTEYLRQRALGYEPRTAPPDALFHFCEKLDSLCEQPFSAEVNTEALILLKEITAELITPRKESTKKWQPPDFGLSEGD